MTGAISWDRGIVAHRYMPYMRSCPDIASLGTFESLPYLYLRSWTFLGNINVTFVQLASYHESLSTRLSVCVPSRQAVVRVVKGGKGRWLPRGDARARCAGARCCSA